MYRKGRGNSRTSSTSKMRKITANRKNRREKGRRADFKGSKPHSNGVLFSRWGGSSSVRNLVREDRKSVKSRAVKHKVRG